MTRMTDTRLVMHSLRARPLSTGITVGMVAIAVALLLTLYGMRQSAQSAFMRGSGNTHLLVSGDASPLAAVLNGVFYANAPQKALTWATYQSIKESFPWAWTVPTQQGDNLRGYPTLCTTPEFFTRFEPTPGEPWELAEGRFFTAPWEIVLGSAAAKGTGLRLGQKVLLTHGSGQSREGGGHEGGGHEGHVHDEFPFTVVGVLKPTGSAHDQALFTDLESSWILHAFDRREAEAGGHLHGEEAKLTAADLTDADRLITGILLRLPTRPGSDASAVLGQQYDALRRMQGIVVAQPAQEVNRLFEIVGRVDGLFIAMAVVVLVSSAVSLLLALYNSMNERRRQIAVLRVLGASQARVFGLMVTESVMIGLLGGAAGVLLALVGGVLAAGYVKDKVGIVIDPALDLRATIVVLGGTVVLAILAGVLPGLRAYRTPVAESLRPAA